ncbi:MAG: T9SS type A sorting domain-containing protein [Fidelibacterota bacterium]|nr:MAG: T9SS type A sorting domain-containing protein [Candidatus Neomarinimicrobiota bacterium]
MYCIRTFLFVLLLSSCLTATIINVPADSSTIQGGINGASDGDTVLVQPDTYYENIIWPDVNGIKLISAGDSSNTVIDGGRIGSVVYMNPSDITITSATQIKGFKITNGGDVQNGGGMFISSASPILSQILVTGNTAEHYGGGIYISGQWPTLTDMTINNNTTTNFYSAGGGGIYISGGRPTLTNLTVSNNTSRSDGGGLCIWNSDAVLIGLTVTGNESISEGGGLFIFYSSPILTNVTVSTNEATYSGGGLSIHSSNPTLTNVTITGNRALYGDGGGGLYIYGSDPILTDVTVTGNRTIYCYGGGGLYIYGGDPILTDVTVTGNEAWFDGLGNGLYLRGSNPSLVGVTITDHPGGNTYNYDALCALYIYSGNLSLTDVTVSRNIGAGLYFRSGSGTLNNVAITGNTNGIYNESGAITIAGSNIASNEIGLYNADSTTIVDADSNWWGDSSGPYHPTTNPNGAGNLVSDYVDFQPWLTEVVPVLISSHDTEPNIFGLIQNYPNPFNLNTTINFDIPLSTHVRIAIYDILGRQIIELTNQYLESDYHQVVWDGKDILGQFVPSGIYIARMVTPGYTNSIKMVLMK